MSCVMPVNRWIPRDRGARVHEGLPPVVQLAAADQHRAHLGQLAGLAGLPVRLRVDDEELRRAQRRGEHVHPALVRRGPDGSHARLRAGASSGRSRVAPMTTVTPNARQETRRAWSDYADRLRGLEGAEYERAEQDAWEQLQATLDAIDAADSPLDHPSVG